MHADAVEDKTIYNSRKEWGFLVWYLRPVDRGETYEREEIEFCFPGSNSDRTIFMLCISLTNISYIYETLFIQSFKG